jgi:hypothetical protein
MAKLNKYVPSVEVYKYPFYSIHKTISNGFLFDTDVLTISNISEGFVIYEKLNF